MDNYQCPKCRSDKVKAGYPLIGCLACGYSEPRFDFPISYNWHRGLCLEYGKPDPGPCEPLEHSIEELHERILVLEESSQPFYEPQFEVNQPHKKPKLAGGVRL